MAAWHDAYRRALAPVKEALAGVVAAEGSLRPKAARPACARLAAALARVDRERLFPVPDLAVDLHLKRALLHLEGAAAACGETRFGGTAHHLHETAVAVRQLDLALGRWGLSM
jgi:hypothetical protein